MKLNLGCGNRPKKGYVNLDWNDFPHVDRVLDLNNLDYPDNSCDEIRMNYVLEHFTYDDGYKVLKNVFRMLKPGGLLVIACPHLEKCMRKWLETKEGKWTYWLYNIYGAQRWKGDVHQSGYTPEFLSAILTEIGFSDIKDISPTDDYHAHNFRLEVRK